MSLPHLPPLSQLYAESYDADRKRTYCAGYTGEQLLAYGRQCREAALEAPDEIEALKKERDALAVDAARYRWLRSSRHNDATVMTYVDGLDDWVAWADGEDVDASIDKAMSQACVQ